jgi:hypothetical protein
MDSSSSNVNFGACVPQSRCEDAQQLVVHGLGGCLHVLIVGWTNGARMVHIATPERDCFMRPAPYLDTRGVNAKETVAPFADFWRGCKHGGLKYETYFEKHDVERGVRRLSLLCYRRRGHGRANKCRGFEYGRSAGGRNYCRPLRLRAQTLLQA